MCPTDANRLKNPRSALSTGPCAFTTMCQLHARSIYVVRSLICVHALVRTRRTNRKVMIMIWCSLRGRAHSPGEETNNIYMPHARALGAGILHLCEADTIFSNLFRTRRCREFVYLSRPRCEWRHCGRACRRSLDAVFLLCTCCCCCWLYCWNFFFDTLVLQYLRCIIHVVTDFRGLRPGSSLQAFRVRMKLVWKTVCNAERE